MSEKEDYYQILGLDKTTNPNLEELYVGKNMSTKIERTSLCRFCKGTGSQDGKEHVCKVCNGQGMCVKMIKSGFMVQQTCEQCRSCNGTGNDKNIKLCKNCNGSR